MTLRSNAIFHYKSLVWSTTRIIFKIISDEFNIIHIRAFIDSSIKYIQQNAHLFQYTLLYLKHYVTNVFRSVVDHLQGGTTSIVYKTRIKIKLDLILP